MDLGKEVVALVKARVDVPGVVEDLLDKVLEEALKEAFAKTSTPIDDALFAMIYPTLESLLKAKVREAWTSLA